MKLRRLIGLIAVSMLLPSCVNQGAIDSLNARVTQNEQRMQHLSSQVGNVEQVLPGQAEMWAQMQAMRQELNLVRGQLDEMTAGNGTGHMAQLTAKVGRMENAVRLMASQMGIAMEILDDPQDDTATTPDDDSAVPTPTPVVTTPGSLTTPPTPPTRTPVATKEQKDTATRLYDSGMDAFASRNYAGAVKAFTDFTKTFPEHNLASNAHFWRGESYFQLKDYARAAGAYQVVLEKHPGSNKFQSAMLKQGMSFYHVDKKEVAAIRLNELIKKYPSSPEAGRAKKFMEQNK